MPTLRKIGTDAISLLASRTDHVLREILRGTLISIAMQVAEAATKFGLNLLLARLLGGSGIGLFYLAFTVTTLGAVAGRLGLDRSLLRHVAANIAVENYAAARGAIVQGLGITLLASSATSLILFGAAPLLAVYAFAEPALVSPLRIMTIAIVPLALLTVLSSMLRALRQIFSSQLILSVMWPLITACGVAALGASVGVVGATSVQLAAMTGTALLGLILLWRASPRLHGIQGRFSTRILIQTSVPLFFVTAMNTLLQWSPNIILGVFASGAEVGRFALASRTAMLAAFAVSAVNLMAAPNFAALHRRGDLETLNATVRHATLLMLLFGGVPIMVLLAFPGSIMALFGEEFRAGGLSLLILTLGQLVSTVCGPAGIVLNMTGHEKALQNITLVALLVTWGLSLPLSALYGGVGMAIAVTAGVTIQNVGGSLFVYRILGILTLPFRLPKPKTRKPT
jgi:O-antigen/teichoic acid export membrane protein